MWEYKPSKSREDELNHDDINSSFGLNLAESKLSTALCCRDMLLEGDQGLPNEHLISF